jgi:BMFP domain-containing protein YqiC
LPEWSQIAAIELSPHDPSTAYVAATKYKLDDTRPLLYRTNDYGASWSEIINGIPEDDFTRSVREDPNQAGLLFAGTETSLYVSFNAGDSWQKFKANLPVVPFYDLLIKDDDLIAATHGRSFWILDDLSQVRQLAADLSGESVHLLKPGTKVRLGAPFGGRKPSGGKNYQLSLGAAVTYTESKNSSGETVRKFLDAGQNPPGGLRVNYYLAEAPDSEATLTFMDSEGNEIKTFSSAELENEDERRDGRVAAAAGLNHFDWNLRYPPANRVPGDKTTEDSIIGPLSPPGAYSVRLTVGDESQTQNFDLVKNPNVEATQEDFDAQFAMLLQLRDKVSETHDNINRLRSARTQVAEWAKRAEDSAAQEAVSASADALKQQFTDIESELIQTEYRGARDRLTLPIKLNAKLLGLVPVVAAADFRPPQQTYEVFAQYTEELDAQFQALQSVIDNELSEFENLLAELQIPTIVPRTTP